MLCLYSVKWQRWWVTDFITKDFSWTFCHRMSTQDGRSLSCMWNMNAFNYCRSLTLQSTWGTRGSVLHCCFPYKRKYLKRKLSGKLLPVLAFAGCKEWPGYHSFQRGMYWLFIYKVRYCLWMENRFHMESKYSREFLWSLHLGYKEALQSSIAFLFVVHQKHP